MLPSSSPNISMARAGSYSGNDTVNRAIPHGLGRVPHTIITTWKSATKGAVAICMEPALIHTLLDDAAAVRVHERAVTTWDNRNFYVGNSGNYPQSMNGSGIVMHWMAV